MCVFTLFFRSSPKSWILFVSSSGSGGFAAGDGSDVSSADQIQETQVYNLTTSKQVKCSRINVQHLHVLVIIMNNIEMKVSMGQEMKFYYS